MNEPEVNTDMDVILREYDMSCPDCDITILEVEQVVKKLKNCKAAGMDEILYEMMYK